MCLQSSDWGDGSFNMHCNLVMAFESQQICVWMWSAVASLWVPSLNVLTDAENGVSGGGFGPGRDTHGGNLNAESLRDIHPGVRGQG